ncbi:MAG: response regulator transcription factor, partial [Clostridium sp.]
MTKKILIAEDDEDIVGLLRLYLEKDGYEIISVDNGEDAFKIVKSKQISLAILDIMMPKMNGYELTKKIREITKIPIIILSAKNHDSEKILGLDLGADDYLTKPFNPLEVVARVKAILRRSYEFKLDEVRKSKEVLKVGELVLDEETVSLTKNGEEIQLTPTEFKILALLMSNPGRVYTKVQIYENINGEYFKNDDGA